MLSKSKSRNTRIYITHKLLLWELTANGVAVQLNRKVITLVDTLVMPSALSR